MKVWVKGKRLNKDSELVPCTVNVANAMLGFHQLGAETILFESMDAIYNWITADDIVVSYIDEVNYALSKFRSGAVAQELNYYPLEGFLGRKIWLDNVDSLSRNTELIGSGLFIKPLKEKAFTGKVIKSIGDLVGCGSYTENYAILCSEILDIKGEWRCFVNDGKIIDIRPYGFDRDFNFNFDYKVVEEMMKEFNCWDDRPISCSIDLCVTGDNRTLLVEINDCYALASYGLDSLLYAKLISARWSQLLDRPDIFNF